MMGANAANRRRAGLQPDGRTVVLDDGSTWDRNTPLPPLPPMVADAVNRVGPNAAPIGNPLAPTPRLEDFYFPNGIPINPNAPAPGGPPDPAAVLPAAPGGAGVDRSFGPPTKVKLLQAEANNGMLGSRAPINVMGAEKKPLGAPMDVGTMPDLLEGIRPATLKPRFFDRGGLGSRLLEGLGEFATYYTAGHGNPASLAVLGQRLRQPELDREAAYRQQQIDVRRAEIERQAARDNQPTIRVVNGQIYSVPKDGSEPTQIGDVPSQAEQYAESLGLTPDDPDWDEAVQDYVLRSYGPTATAGRVALENTRQGNRKELEGIRQSNRVALRGVPTWGNTHPRPSGGGGGGHTSGGRATMAGVIAPILAKLSRGEPLTAAEQQAMAYYRPPARGRGGRGGIAPAPPAPPPPPRGRAPIRVRTLEEARRLPKGTHFIDPYGRPKVR